MEDKLIYLPFFYILNSESVFSTLFIKFLIVFDIYFEMNRPKNDANTYCI